MPPVADRIAERLHHALDHHHRAGISAPTAERGLAVRGPDNPVVVLSVDNVARIAALVISDDVASHSPTPDAARQQSGSSAECGVQVVRLPAAADLDCGSHEATSVAEGETRNGTTASATTT